MNGAEPHGWLKSTLEEIAAGCPNSHTEELSGSDHTCPSP